MLAPVWLVALLGAALAADEASLTPRTPPAPAVVAGRTELPASPRWIVHVVTPRERLTQLAVRYGVTTAQILEWNEGRAERRAGEFPKGTRLRIHARRIPPPRERVEVEVAPGDTFSRIATRYRVEYRDLRAYNWPMDDEDVQPGRKVVVWVDPEFPPRTVNVRPGSPPPASALSVPQGARSVGRPQKGRLENGVQLPPSPLYTVREPAIAWASSHTIAVLQRGIADFRTRTGFAGEVQIASMSRARGGRFRPHVSHQSGRDVDIRLPQLPGARMGSEPNPDEIDWSASWELIRSLAALPEVQVIFLEIGLQRRVYQAALWEGATEAEIAPILQWPTTKGDGAIVRHSEGHDGHIHLRVRCGPDEPKCRGR
jgi:murein endopeptidase